MSMMNKLMDFLGIAGDERPIKQDKKHPEYEYEEDEWLNEEAEQQDYKPKLQRGQNTNNLVQLQSMKTKAKLELMEPYSYEETQDMADHLRNRKIIIVNLQRLPHEQAKRMVDFLSGTVYAIGGHIHKLGPNIFICTSDNVEIHGNISDMFDEIQSRMR